MATERQSPDVLLEQTNLTGTISEIQDDPDSPDGNWLDAIANNVASICRTSFPTPTGNPTVGAGLQEFRILVRKFGGTGTPTAWIELYENGVLIRAGSAQNVTGNLVISFTWNANEILTADGSLVECRLNSTAIGGAPAARACVEVGAVEWNVVYSAGVVVTPSVLSLTSGTFAPNVSISDNQSVILGTLNLILTAYAPIVTASDHKTVIPSTPALVITFYTPTVTVGASVEVIPGTLSIAITLYASTITVSDNKIVTPDMLAHTVTLYAPTTVATDNKVVTPDSLANTIALYSPLVVTSDNQVIIPGTLSLVVTVFAPAILVGGSIEIIPGTQTLSFTLYVPIVGTSSLRILFIKVNCTILQDLNMSLVSKKGVIVRQNLNRELVLTNTTVVK